MYGEKEFLKTLLENNNVVENIKANLDKLIEIIPEIRSMIGFEHKHPHHHLAVWEHTLYALSLSINDFDVRLALLLHDIGKPKCFQEDGEIRHFKGHQLLSSQIANDILKRLNYKEDYIIVTMDCDGQHTIKDALNLGNYSKEHKDELVLGKRIRTENCI